MTKEVNIGKEQIPLLGFGTWELVGDQCYTMVKEAIKAGYRHIDTAQFYENEEQVGRAIRESGISRRELFVTTKIWGTDASAEGIKLVTKQSLKRLGLEKVNLLLLHWRNPAVPLEESLRALDRMKQEGLTAEIGVSNFTSAMIHEAVRVYDGLIATNQIEYHPFLSQTKVIHACKDHKITITAFCPIARGRVFQSATLKRISTKHGKTPAQVSLRWLLQQDVVAIPRTTSVARLKENLSILDFELSDHEMKEISSLAEPNGRIVDFSWAPTWDS